jgi:hypothetical protein
LGLPIGITATDAVFAALSEAACAPLPERIAAEHGTAPWTTRDGCEGWSR